MEIKILNLERVETPGPVKCLASIKAGDWEIHGWKVIKKEGERAQVAYPSIKWIDSYGVKRFRALLSVPAEVKQRIDVAILSAWDAGDQNGQRGK